MATRGAPAVSVPRLSAAVVALADSPPGGPPEVLLAVRGAALESAPGAAVFPGGALDERLDGGSLRACALRECLEETGVSLRGELVPLCRWVTPEVERRRFDTTFFAVRAGEAERSFSPHVDAHGESSSVGWVRPTDALARHRDGELVLLPPQWHTLRWLAGFESASAALDAAARRSPPTFRPAWDRARGALALGNGQSILVGLQGSGPGFAGASFELVDGDGRARL